MTYISFFIIMTSLLNSQKEDTKFYQVKKINGKEIAVTGKGENPLWKTANELSDFIYPWENDKPTLTTFKALHNDNWVYCLFTVVDENLNIYVDTNDKLEVVHSDRVEIFFRQDERLSPYYCLELDPNGRVLDYKGDYYRKGDMKWSWPAGHLIVKAAKSKKGYTVEVAVSKASLRELGLLKDNQLQAGLYRGECVALNGKDATLKWISWIRPDSKTPDFHIPSSFGVLSLQEK